MISSMRVATAPANGVISIDGPIATYIPVANYFGGDTFSFTATDASDTSAPSEVALTITLINDAPVPAEGLAAAGDEDTLITVELAATDVDGDPLTFAINSQPAHGTAPGADYLQIISLSLFLMGRDDHANYRQWSNDRRLPRPGMTTLFNEPARVTVIGNDVDGDALTFAVVNATTVGCCDLRDFNGVDKLIYATSRSSSCNGCNKGIGICPANYCKYPGGHFHPGRPTGGWRRLSKLRYGTEIASILNWLWIGIGDDSYIEIIETPFVPLYSVRLVAIDPRDGMTAWMKTAP